MICKNYAIIIPHSIFKLTYLIEHSTMFYIFNLANFMLEINYFYLYMVINLWR